MKLAIVGAGRGGTNLLKVFDTIKDIDVAVVVDTNANADGVLFAQEKGIPWDKDLGNIGHYHVDLIIEATGSDKVITRLRELYQNSHQIIDAQMAQVLNHMVDGQVALLEQMGRQMDAIQRLSVAFSNEFDRLAESVESIRRLNGNLNLAVENSHRYIERTDEVISQVAKISMQTKILGLNANIEAARAGEHGKGFAVVANEVQKLSDHTSQFSKEISGMLKELTIEIQKVSEATSNLSSVSQIQGESTKVMDQAISELSHTLGN